MSCAAGALRWCACPERRIARSGCDAVRPLSHLARLVRLGRMMSESWLEYRSHMVDLAFRMLGRIGDAEDVVQEAYARAMRVDAAGIENPRAWLTVVVSRLCL